MGRGPSHRPPRRREWLVALIAVTSVYLHRATSLLRKCHQGPVEVVTPPRDIDLDWVGKIGHEWAGYLASLVLNTTC